MSPPGQASGGDSAAGSPGAGPAAPRLRLASRPQYLPGAAWGIAQPLLLCSFRLHGAPGPGTQALRTVLETWVEDPCAADEAEIEVDAEVGVEAGAGVGIESDAPVDVHAHADRALLRMLHRCCVAVQREQNLPVFGTCGVLPVVPTDATSPDGRVRVLAMPCPHQAALRAALDWALHVVNAGDAGIVPSGAPPTEAADERVAGLQALRLRIRAQAGSSTNTLRFLAAAHAMGLPVTPLVPGTYLLGYGERSRWLDSSITDRTPNIGVKIANRKDHTAALLMRAGLPVPRHRPAASEAAAVDAARHLGFPVVVKPADQEQGRGVFTRLRDDEQVRRSWREAATFSKRILVEAWHAGEDYRITVAHGRIVKVMHRRPGGVVGDGRRSVRELVLLRQASPEQQRAFRRSGVYRLALDAEADELLAEQGLQPESVPAAGQEVLLRRKANISAGGTHRLLDLAAVHPDNQLLAQRAAALLRLDLAGIDLISPDIAQAWHRNGAVICEVNAQPQLGYRDLPQLYEELLQEMVGTGPEVVFHALMSDSREPVAPPQGWPAFASEQGCNAWSNAQGAWLDGRQVCFAPADSVASARTLLMERGLRGALMVLRAEDVVRRGLPVGRLASLGLLRRPGGEADAPDPVLQQALQMCRPHVDRLIRNGPAAAPGPAR